MANQLKQITIENKKAYFDYFIDDTLECGISLNGNEVKSIRSGMASIKGAWCQIQNNTLVLRGMHITKWDTSNTFDIDEDRERILLAHKKEILSLQDKVKLKGITLVPLRVYFSRNKCKVLIGICRGKHTYDKRECQKERDAKREIARSLKDN